MKRLNEPGDRPRTHRASGRLITTVTPVRQPIRQYVALLSVGLTVGATLGAAPALARGIGHGSPNAFRGLYEKQVPPAISSSKTGATATTPERGRFGRLFELGTKFKGLDGKTRRLKAHPADIQSLRRLGASNGPMHSKSDADSRDSTIPAGYTFFGQFVDHDITLDTVSSLDKPILDIDSVNSRTPTLDLDSVYGGGPDQTPYLYNLPYLQVGAKLATGRYDLLRRTTVTASADEGYEGAKTAVPPKQPEPKKAVAPTPSASSQTSSVNDAISGGTGADAINDILGGGGGSTQPKVRKEPKTETKTPAKAPKTAAPREPSGRYARGGVKRDVALIGDPRNDENVVLTQMQAAVIAFHNRIADLLLEKDGTDLNAIRDKIANAGTLLERRKAEEDLAKVTRDIFHRARRHTIHYYHRVLVEDFIPRIIGVQRTQKIRQEGRLFYFPEGFKDHQTGRTKSPYIPVEFSVAAYRYGHSQVRNSYVLSKYTKGVPLFGKGAGPDGIDMMGFKPMTKALLIDWRYYFPFAGETGLVQSGRPINTSLPDSLFRLVEGGIVPPGDISSLASRNLNRGRNYFLPSGQALARVMNLPAQMVVGADHVTRTILNLKETPLWYYILQEAKQQGVSGIGNEPYGFVRATQLAPSVKVYTAALKTDTDQTKAVTTHTGSSGGDILGPVGGTIVGEVLLGLIEHYRVATGEGIDFSSEIDGLMSSTTVEGVGKIYQMSDLLKDAGVAIPIR